MDEPESCCCFNKTAFGERQVGRGDAAGFCAATPANMSLALLLAAACAVGDR